ncbi:hypothetical protein JTB14_019976 [Gonioctena quinquepunctata]|nr:hypothetical protein JTB14_019976 [Gonioctena quinquepunctata]
MMTTPFGNSRRPAGPAVAPNLYKEGSGGNPLENAGTGKLIMDPIKIISVEEKSGDLHGNHREGEVGTGPENVVYFTDGSEDPNCRKNKPEQKYIWKANVSFQPTRK